MQNDFCSPEGALYVNGAEQDLKNVASFIAKQSSLIDHIILTQDNHHVIDISHPYFWTDKNGNYPQAFTTISADDVNSNKWRAGYYKEEAINYINELYKQGEYPHIIWPEHCIVGSKGAAIADELMVAIIDWSHKGRFFELIQKGLNPITEHFGALRANIPNSKDPSTMLNTSLIESLHKYNRILIAGEAKSHCVANTIKQICESEGLAQKLIILEDCMSNVTGMDKLADPIYKMAKQKGARFQVSQEITLN